MPLHYYGQSLIASGISVGSDAEKGITPDKAYLILEKGITLRDLDKTN